ncbi:Uncharacterised protein [Vibrio cholerae]|nr:Uncharacterised protein [Vibrio cholerae]
MAVFLLANRASNLSCVPFNPAMLATGYRMKITARKTPCLYRFLLPKKPRSKGLAKWLSCAKRM